MTNKLINYLTFIIFTLIFITSLLLLSPEKSYSQFRTLDIAVTHKISDKSKPGDIVSLTGKDGELEPSKVAYDQKMFAVVVQFPAFVIRTIDTNPVSRTGVSLVNVTTLGGPIQIGDFITSSPIPGHGQKAENLGGYMLGIALEDFTEKKGTPMDYEKGKVYKGQMKVEIGIGPASPTLIKASGGLFGTLKQVASALTYNLLINKDNEKIIRYFIAALVAVIVIFINFNTFGKNITKGIEAIGRNPLAKVSIQSMIVANVILIALVSLGGIVLSLAIISL